MRQSGARRPLAILYGLLPQAARELTSYTVYRWECAIRASVVMGFVGAGGLGQLMDQAMKMLNGSEAASILLAFVALVLAADLLSGLLRRWMDAAPAQRASPFGWRGASGAQDDDGWTGEPDGGATSGRVGASAPRASAPC